MEQFFAQWGPTSSMFWVRALWAVAAWLLAVWVANVARHGTGRAMLRAGAPPNARLFLERIAQLGVLVLGAILALGILGLDVTALTAFIGLATIALSVSLQDILRGLVTGLYLLIEHPFQVGDTVEVAGQTGVIEDVGVRATILRNAQGDRVIVPNLTMFTSTIVQKNVVKGNP
jgi:small-conductance mechanosensitive channel